MNMEPNTLGWHPGEIAAHKLLKVPTSLRHNPTQPGLSFSHGYRVAESPIVALGTLDSQGNIWTTLWGGGKGFARPVAKGVLALQSLVAVEGDPFVEALLHSAGTGNGNADGDGVIKPEGNGKMMSGLSVNLETRDRVKLAGRLLVASLDNKGGSGEKKVREIQMAMAVDEGLGNCPKYMNRKEIHAHVPNPETVVVVPRGKKLPDEGVRLISKADMMFLSSTNGRTMDTNHRGGPRGFIRVLRNGDSDGGENGEGEVVLVYPEYSGNQLYQSLGNLQVNPRVGIVIPDYDTSDVLYLTGETQLLVGPAAAAVMPHCKVAVKVSVKEARFVKDGLPFRGVSLEQSPYNPPVRRLASEGPPGAGVVDGTGPAAIARLVKKEVLAPTIARFTFQLSTEKGRLPPPAWKPGQHVTMDFSGELDQGWSHMREDDPQSLNDDFVRTFTVSNSFLPEDLDSHVLLETGSEGGLDVSVKLEITVRRHGPVTGFLWSQQQLQNHSHSHSQSPLEIPVLGFGGEESFRIPVVAGSSGAERRSVFVAGGVGITPLLAQAPGLLKEDVDFVLLWSLRAQDLGLVVDSFGRIPGLAGRTRLFVTGAGRGAETEDEAEKVRGLGVQAFVQRRLLREDLLGAKHMENGNKFYLCAGVDMTRVVEGWLQGEEFVSESFNY
ncbi:hypothetical protein V8F20_003387 [Naviculisporaceae sp. PSN 640]